MAIATETPELTAAQPNPTHRRRRRRHRDTLWGHLFLGPWFIGFFVLTLGPMIASLYLSMTDFSLLSKPNWIGLKNYVDMFTNDPKYLASIKATVIYVVLGVPAQLIVALAVAVFLNRAFRGMDFYRSVFYLPSLLGGSVAVAVLWQQLFADDGLLNQLLGYVGIQGPAWISEPETAIYTLIVLHVWQFGAPMVIFLAGLRQIPLVYQEAARVDGANRAQIFFRVTIPLLSPIIFFNLIMQVIGAFQAFAPAFIISDGSGGPANSLLFYTLYLYQQGFGNFHMGYASAMAWVLFVAVAALTAVNFALSKYWVHYDE